MKVSVITVCLNANNAIANCLKSVADQTYPAIEHVVIDGGSTDGTIETVKSYPHVASFVSEPDSGIYQAMNKGVSRATGEFLIFLNADDLFAAPDALEVAMKAIKKLPHVDVAYGSLHVREKNGNSFVFHPPPPKEAPEFLVCGCLPHQSTLARRVVFEKTNAFNEEYRIFGDYDWFLKIFADPTIKIERIDSVLGSYFWGGISTNLRLGQPELYHIQNGAALFASREWDKRRIRLYQAQLLELKLQLEEFQRERQVQNSQAIKVKKNKLMRMVLWLRIVNR